MTTAQLAGLIDALWDRRTEISSATRGPDRDAVDEALALLELGAVRVAEPAAAGGWQVNQWLKKAVLLSFRLNDSAPVPGAGGAPVFDKVPMKFAGWGENRFAEAGFRAVPGAVVRRSAFIGPRRRADAELRECRRLCGRRHDDRYLGDGRQLRADRQELPYQRRRRHRRRAGAAAGQPGRHRG